ncbi:uncharacterized protein LOC128964380 [Oppia nitens]|uniref:uncharacterized protein LOC128964380 n=1 Tax=Oppia nitens TaxID=1686743 RepID=UPI0023DC10BD|nr:uncharacterized protein LOC128964380 [Oppia nitens]
MQQNLLMTIEILLISLLAMSNTIAGDNILSNLADLANIGNCGLRVSESEDLKQCKQKVTEDWKLETDVKRQACCQPIAFLDCTLKIAKSVCNDQEYQQMSKVEKSTVQQADTSCLIYRQTPSLCGTNTILPIFSFIITLALVVVTIG